MATAALSCGTQIIDRSVKIAHQALGYRDKIFALSGGANLSGSALQ